MEATIGTNDYHGLLELITSKLPQHYAIKELGRAEGEKVVLLSPENIDPKKKSVLVVAGFHGDEIAGPWGCCKFMVSKSRPDHLLNSLNTSFIPVVSPQAFIKGTRNNNYGEEPNQGFFYDYEHLSHEGKILWNHMDELVRLSKDGFLSLHESSKQTKYFFYLDQVKINDILRYEILKAVSDLGILPDGIYKYPDGQIDYVRGGCVENQFDGTFEHHLYARGAAFCVTSETPIGEHSLLDRINANARVIVTVLKNVYEGSNKTGDWINTCI